MDYRFLNNLTKVLLFFSVVLSAMPIAFAHDGGGEAYVRVVSANPETRTYTFSCDMDPNNDYLRDFFIRQDSGDFNSPLANEAESLDRPAGDDFTYTFQSEGFYHVGCIIVNETNFSTLYRGDLHIDLRTSSWDPEIIPVSGNALTVELEAQHSGSGTPSWEVLNAQTGESTSLASGETIQFTALGHGLYDFVLTADGRSVGLPIEFFDQGDPYFPNSQGIPDGITNIWIRETQPPQNETNQTEQNNTNQNNPNQIGLNRVDTDGGLQAEFLCKPEGSSNNLVVDWNFGDGNFIYDVADQQTHNYAIEGNYFVQCDVWDNVNAQFTSLSEFFTIQTGETQPPQNETNQTEQNNTNQGVFYNLNGLPASCENGTITSDTYDGGRHITCVNPNNDQLSINAWDKPTTQNAQYFEMYKQSSSGNSLKICLADTCISSNGFARSPDYPLTVSGTQPPQNETNQTEQNNTNQNNTNQIGLNRVDTDGGLQAEFLCKPEGSSNNLVVDWNFGDGNFIYDVADQQTHNYAIEGNYFVQCDVWDNVNAQFTSLSEFFSVQTGETQPPQNETNQTEQLSDPVWLSHSGTTGISPTYFHFESQEANNLSIHASSEWEILTQSREAIWSFYDAQGILRYHVHTPDGNFQGSLQGSDQLNYDTTYTARVRYKSTTGSYTNWVERSFTTASAPVLNETSPDWTPAQGFRVETFATGFDAPIHVKAAPQNLYSALPDNQKPYLYVTELYGTIKVVYKDGSTGIYADNLLNFDPFGSITGGGQMGLIGLHVDSSGDLYVGTVYIDESDNNEIKNRIIKFNTSPDGSTYDSQEIIIENLPSAPSHQIEDITMHNGRLYVGLGDALVPSNAQSDSILAGKIISLNPDGSDVQIYAKGLRNPFGQDWSSSGVLYSTDNAPDVNDKLAKIIPGGNYGWGMDDNFATFDSQRIATLDVSPVDVEFNYDSQFPSELYGKLYVAVAGPIYQQGPTSGKEILEFTLDNEGNIASSRVFTRYTGDGYGTPMGLEFHEGALYFTDIYGEPGFVGLGETEANLYRIVPGEGTPTNQTGEFRAGVSIIPWYPKDTGDGIEYIFECNGIDGSGNYLYDFDYGDGSKVFNYEFNRFYKKYPYGNTDYTVSCTIKDQTTQQQASKSITINPSDFISEQ